METSGDEKRRKEERRGKKGETVGREGRSCLSQLLDPTEGRSTTTLRAFLTSGLREINCNDRAGLARTLIVAVISGAELLVAIFALALTKFDFFFVFASINTPRLTQKIDV